MGYTDTSLHLWREYLWTMPEERLPLFLCIMSRCFRPPPPFLPLGRGWFDTGSCLPCHYLMKSKPLPFYNWCLWKMCNVWEEGELSLLNWFRFIFYSARNIQFYFRYVGERFASAWTVFFSFDLISVSPGKNYNRSTVILSTIEKVSWIIQDPKNELLLK